jgi:hypothetical protein
MSRTAGAAWNRGISLADPDADTRELIVAADVVVGFQTTALYEAVAAGKPVVFTAWGAEYERLREQLIRFDEAPPGCVWQADSAARLSALLTEASGPSSAGCTAWYEEALGRVDGHATERVAQRLEAVAAGWPVTAERRDLERRRRRFAIGLLVRSLAAETVWTVGAPVAGVTGQRRRVAARRRRAREGRALAATALRGRRGPDLG